MDFGDLERDLGGCERLLQGSDRMDLLARDRAWVLRSGRMAVFAARRRPDGRAGARTFLFEVGPGEVLFGLGPEDPVRDLSLEAMPIEETRALEFAPEALEALRESRSREVALWALESWMGRFADLLEERPPALLPIPVEGGGPLVLPKGQPCRAPGTLTWCRLKGGSASWMGLADRVLDEATGVFPVGDRIWLQAETPLELVPCDPASLGFGSLTKGAHVFLGFALRRLAEQLEAAESRTRARAFERIERERQIREAAIASLAEMADSGVPEPLELGGPPLLAAARAVGHAMGIAIRPPARSEVVLDGPGMLAAIARASRMKTRLVSLEPGFWRQDSGPLLAFKRDGMKPVALLRESGGYVLLDPESEERRALTEAEASGLHQVAVMFYRPLPEAGLDVAGILRFALAGHSRELRVMGAVGVLGAILGLFMPYALGILVDQAIPDSNQALLLQLGGGFLATALGVTIFQVYQGVLVLRVETLADAGLQPAVWDRVLSLAAPFFRRYSVGDLNARIMGISQIRQRVSGTTLRTVFAGVFSLLNLVLMFLYDAGLALVASALGLGALLVTYQHCRLKLRQTRPLRRLEAEIFGQVVQLVGGVNKLRVSGSEGRAFSRWGRGFREKQVLVHRVQAIENSLSVFNLLYPGFCSVLLFYMVHEAMASGQSGGLTTGTFLAFNVAFGVFLTSAAALSDTLIDLLDVRDLWVRSRPLLDEPLEVTSSKLDPGVLRGEIAMDRVSFHYEGSERLILSDVSLRAAPGEHVALVGSSGCGKSTIFRLLLGFEAPVSGVISIDGQDLSRLDLRGVRRQMGVVLQTAKLMAGSLFENIACGALITQEDAWEAARKAGFEDDIRRMPMGLNTMVAEAGANLSGGQRQRLILARAFALRPTIMLLDEATSALDNQTQAIVARSLTESRITRISIAHRLSTIRDADRIYVLDAGRVVQVGTFDELIAQEGLFARLAAFQKL